MTAINLPFAASATKRAPNADELANGFGCGDADLQLFDWLAWWETGQIANVIAKSGLSIDDTDIQRLAKAIRSQAMNYVGTVTGTANALTLTLDPAPAALAELTGVPLRLKMALANTSAVTINPNALGATALVGPGGAPIPAYAWAPGDILEVVFDGTSFRVISGIAQQRTRFKNIVDNPLFSVYQRRTNPYTGETLAAGAYGLDRWKAGSGGCTFTRSGVTLTITAGTLVQLVEGAGGPFSVGDNWGQMTLSWAGTAQARVNGGAYGSSPQTVTIANNSKITLEWSTGTLSQPQLEFGPRPTTFEARTFAEEVNVCLRFCRLVTQDQGFVAAAAGNYQKQSVPIMPMPATPSISQLSAGTAVNASSAIITSAETWSVTMTLVATAAGTCDINKRVFIVEAEPA